MLTRPAEQISCLGELDRTGVHERSGFLELHFKRKGLHFFLFPFLPSYKCYNVLLSMKADEKLPVYFVLGQKTLLLTVGGFPSKGLDCDWGLFCSPRLQMNVCFSFLKQKPWGQIRKPDGTALLRDFPDGGCP